MVLFEKYKWKVLSRLGIRSPPFFVSLSSLTYHRTIYQARHPSPLSSYFLLRLDSLGICFLNSTPSTSTLPTPLRQHPLSPHKMASQTFRKIEPTPMNFLSLAPSTSQSYPNAQDIKPASGPRRSSSTSSAEAKSLRFLKLGPVHWGEHPGEHKEDWHEVTNEVAVE